MLTLRFLRRSNVNKFAVRMTYPHFNTGFGHSTPAHTQGDNGKNMCDDEHIPPQSEGTVYENIFIHKINPKDFKKPWEVKGHSIESEYVNLTETSGDPHHIQGWQNFGYKYNQYYFMREPVFPRTPNIMQGELVSGANLARTTAFTTVQPDEPAIVQIAAFSPDNFQHVDLAKNLPFPATANPENGMDFRKARLPINHADRRPFMFFCMAGVFGGVALFVRHVLLKIGYQWWPKKKVFMAGTSEVNLSDIEVGQNFVTKWRSKPMFIRRRSPEQIALAQKDDEMLGVLRDPQRDTARTLRAEWLICGGNCTHLGCVPFADAGDYGGYFCACHGSHYDLSGRIRKGPAPRNLPVPPYKFLDDNTVLIG